MVHALDALEVRTTRDTTVSVATSSTQLVRGNPNRARFYVVNRGPDPIHLRKGQPATTTTGFRLDAGQTMVISVDVDGEDTWDEWNAITPNSAQTVAVIEQEAT